MGRYWSIYVQQLQPLPLMYEYMFTRKYFVTVNQAFNTRLILNLHSESAVIRRPFFSSSAQASGYRIFAQV